MPCSCNYQLITEAQLCAVEFLETILSLSTCLQWHPGGYEPVCEHFMRLLTVQKDIGLAWLPRLSSTIVSLFIIIVQSELEHEQISILKLLLLILKWKYDSGMFSIAVSILRFTHACKSNALDKCRILLFLNAIFIFFFIFHQVLSQSLQWSYFIFSRKRCL